MGRVHGDCSSSSAFWKATTITPSTMKAFAAALTGLVAAVSAEAEPWLGYGLGVPAVGLPVPVAPLVAHPNGAVTPDYTPAQKLAAADHFAKGGGRVTALPVLAHGLWKREAEAEAKPWGVYGYGLPALGYGYGHGYGLAGGYLW